MDECKLRRYYLENMGGWDKPSSSIKLDENEVPVKVNDNGMNGYSPVDVGNYALWNWNKLLDSKPGFYDDTYQRAFISNADWFVRHIKKDGSWKYYYDNVRYKLKAPWVGALAQGFALSTLTRAYELTKNEKYLDAARSGYKPFTLHISDGGVMCGDADGGVWYEEYAVLPAPRILNGFMSALLGLYDLAYVTEDDNVLKSFNNGMKTLSRNLYRYDLGYWSLYNLIHEHPATYRYHHVHVQQLNALFKITNGEIVGEYARKWQGYLDNKYCVFKAKMVRNIVHVKRRIK